MLTENLTPDEKHHLLHIYRQRLRFFLPSMIGMMLLAFSKASPDAVEYMRKKDKPYDHLELTLVQEQLLMHAWLQVPLLTCAFFIYRWKIHPFRLDARNGVKQLVPYTIIRKSYFSNINKYYISFDDPAYMHHEVDDVFFFHCTEGDTAYLNRAPRSKYVFNRNGSFSIL